MQLSVCLDKYTLSRLNLAQSSVDQLRYSVTAYERFCGSEQSIESITEEQLGRFARHRLKTSSPATAKRNLANLITLLRFALKRGFLTGPLPDLEPIRVVHPTPTAWTLADLGSILRVCGQLTGCMRGTAIPRSLWWTSLILFLYDSGARVGAALQLRWEDVLPEARSAVLRASCAKTRTEQIVSLGEDTVTALDRLRSLSIGGEVWSYPYRSRQLWLDLHAILDSAGLDARGVGFHRLRKTHATQTVIATGWESARVSLGHTEEAMTRRYIDLRQIPRGASALPRPPYTARIGTLAEETSDIP